MTPYYADESAVIYHGDCRELLPSLVADAVITDPPYDARTHAGARSGSQDVAIRIEFAPLDVALVLPLLLKASRR